MRVAAVQATVRAVAGITVGIAMGIAMGIAAGTHAETDAESRTGTSAGISADIGRHCLPCHSATGTAPIKLDSPEALRRHRTLASMLVAPWFLACQMNGKARNSSPWWQKHGQKTLKRDRKSAKSFARKWRGAAPSP